MNLNEVLKVVYNLDHEECAQVIRQIARTLHDDFCDTKNGPPEREKKILDDLLTMADRVEEFYK